MTAASRAEPGPNGIDFQQQAATDAARHILAAMLESPQAAATASSRLSAGDFQYLSHGRIFGAVQAILERGEPPDIVTVAEYLSANSPDPDLDRGEFIKVTEYTGVRQNLPGHIRVLRDFGARRQSLRLADQLAESARNPAVTMSEALGEIGSRLESVRVGGLDGGGRFSSACADASELVSRTIPKPRSLLGECVLTAGGFSILYGKPGVGKTWLALHQAIALARGEPWLGLATPPGGVRVGLLELELGAYSLQQRLLALGVGSNPLDINLRIICRPDLRGAVDLVRPAECNALREWMVSDQLELVIVDALSRAHTAGESDEQEMGALLASFDALRHETGCAIEPVHHERKGQNGHGADDDDDLDALRGHSRLQSDPTLLIRVKALRGGKLFTMRFAKVSEAATPPHVFFRHTEHGAELCESPEQVADGNREKVLKAIPYPPASVANDEIQSATGLKRPTVLKHLKALIQGLEVTEIRLHKRLTYCRTVTTVTQGAVTVDNRYEANDLLDEHGF